LRPAWHRRDIGDADQSPQQIEWIEVGADVTASDVVPDNVTLGLLNEGVRAYALDRKNAEALWRKCEELEGKSFGGK
jgi:hypothetical protein